MLVNFNEMLLNAKKGKYAVPHLNINNLEWTKYILEECQELNIPVILGVSEGAAKYMGGFETIVGMVKGLVKDKTIPVCLHLDHGQSFDSCKAAIDAGFTSVMIDASRLELEENIKTTKEVVDYAHERGVSVEAEVGHIGGTEDNVTSTETNATLEECKAIYEGTGIDALAPALGSVHGLYKGEPKINFDRMEKICKLTNLPLVLHGGSGIYDEQIKKAISCGICKINFNTELQIAWSNSLREKLKIDDSYDPRKVIKMGQDALKKCVRNKCELLGSVGRY